jgi:hypothetical protein
MGSAAFESRPRTYYAFSTALDGNLPGLWPMGGVGERRSLRVHFIDVHELQPGGMQTSLP